MTETWISPKARKGVTSGIAGRGLRAVEPISAGEVIAVKGGHVMTVAEHLRLPDPLPNSSVQITDDLVLVARDVDEYEAVMLFINHSCEPNVGIGGNVVLIAMRDVSAGEELSIDYAMFDDYDGRMTCGCGSPSCRNVIDGRDWRRHDLQARYRGWFSWYLQRKIDALSDTSP
jgi:uncharacterized protein